MAEHLAITLFRHGITAENERHAYIGWSDGSLSQTGKEQLSKYRLFSNHYDIYVCSDLKRCVETAEILFPDKSFIKWPSFREMNFGEWEGKTYEKLKDQELYKEWLEDYVKVCPPGGEDFFHFTHRIDAGWSQLLDHLFTKGLRKAVVVTHGGVMRYLLSKLAPCEAEFWDWKIPHNISFEMIWTTKKGKGEVRCTLLREVILTENPSG